MVQRVLQADQEIVFVDQRHKAQAEGPGRRLDARAGVGRATGQRGGHGQVAVFRWLEPAGDGLGHQPLLGQQVVHQQAGARAALPVEEARGTLALRHQIGQAPQPQRIAGLHHQALGAADAADQLVQAGLEQRLHRRGELA